MSVDTEILDWVGQHRSPAVTAAARGAMDLGMSDAVVLGVALAGLVVVAVRRWWWQAIALGAAVLGAQAVARALKELIQRPRPAGELTIVQVGAFSMPSTVAAMTAAGAVVGYLVVSWPGAYRGWVLGAIVAVLIGIGAAMVYLGAHWPTDLLVGWAVGAVVGVVVLWVVRGVARRLPVRRGGARPA
ncbi:phosphatase PAP2 family protein [Nocardia sp. NPDC048505]|uniref:phosphatase PAP2 family protein n=1 Tax=unclassified Nocardia TaxID=2637762 RepID=UPI0034106935